MNVGFYYHVEALFEPSGIVRVPSLLGMFIEELAKRVGRITFYAHGSAGSEIEDHELRESLVRCVDLGPRPRLPMALFAPGRSLRAFRPREHELDVMLIRGSTPLLPHLVKRCKDIPVALHIVADYASTARDRKARSWPWWRDALLTGAFWFYGRLQRRAARHALVAVNAPHLRELFPDREDIDIVIESTLDESSLVDAPKRADPTAGRERRADLLLAGRVVPEKGLWEAAEAVCMLAERGIDVGLGIVGWNVPTDPVHKAFWSHVRSLGAEDRVRFHGYVPAGPELAEVYRRADVYVLPSWGEGFPRTIVEAMGAGVPVVTTPVGGVPHWLRHGEQALFVQPRSAGSLADAVEALLTDTALYERVADAGWQFARTFTLERACKDLATKLEALQRREAATASHGDATGARN